MGYFDLLDNLHILYEEDENNEEKPKRVKRAKPTYDQSKVIAEDDLYVVLRIDSVDDLYKLGKGTDWSLLKLDIDDINGAWKQFSKTGKIYVATKKILGNLAPRRTANRELHFNRTKVYPFWDKILIRVDSNGKATYWNTGDFEYNEPKVELPKIKSESGERLDTWKERPDGTIDVHGDVILDDSMLIDGYIPHQFNRVFGKFSLSKCTQLLSYEGSPETVYGDFLCATKSNIENFEGCPHIVGGNFVANNHKSITSLSGSPYKVVKGYNVSHCPLIENLVGAPEDVGSIFVSYCKNLTTLEGAPQLVRGDFIATFNPSLLSLKYLPDVTGKMDFTGCKRLSITDLRNRFGYIIPKNFIHPIKERWEKMLHKLKLLNEKQNKRGDK